MDYSALDFWWKVAITLLNFGIGVYLWYERREDKTSSRIVQIVDSISRLKTDMDTRMDDTRHRLTRLEASSTHDKALQLEGCCADITERVASLEQHAADAPKHDDLARLHARIDDVAGAIKHLQGESTAQTRILNLVYESLIKK